MAAENAATAISVVGAKPSPAATPAMMGIAIVEVAVFEVTSVRKTKSAAISAISTIGGIEPRLLTPDPIHVANPERSMARASERPPPNSTSTSHGIFLAVGQSRAKTPRLRSTGMRNRARAPAMAMVPSDTNGRYVWIPGIDTPSITLGERNTQARAVRVNTTATLFSPRLARPSAVLCSASTASASPDICPGGYRK